MVRAAELGAGGREATAGDEVGGHSGAEGGGSVHLGAAAVSGITNYRDSYVFNRPWAMRMLRLMHRFVTLRCLQLLL